MTKTEKFLHLYTHKLFPRFSTPVFSRFSGLFSQLSDNDPDSDSAQLMEIYAKELNVELNMERYRIDPEKILNGFEKRNSIIIKGIPADLGPLNFYQLLTNFSKDIKFFYIPGFAIAKWKYIYAFVTINRRMGVLNIFEGLTIMRDKFKTYKGSDFSKIEIYFCKSQNIISLTKKYQKKVNNKNTIICK